MRTIAYAIIESD